MRLKRVLHRVRQLPTLVGHLPNPSLEVNKILRRVR